MTYQFTPDLETGNAAIDGQHKELIGALNDLLDACHAGKGRDHLQKTTDFLYNYTIKHFADEERLQQQYHYPEYAAHRQYHEGFKKTVGALMNKLIQEGPTVVLVSEVNTAVAGWLISHIKREDRKVADFIKASKA